MFRLWRIDILASNNDSDHEVWIHSSEKKKIYFIFLNWQLFDKSLRKESIVSKYRPKLSTHIQRKKILFCAWISNFKYLLAFYSQLLTLIVKDLNR